jgi:hypothetical protein
MASRCSQVSVTQAEIEADRNPPRSVRRKRTKKSPVAVRHRCPDSGTDGVVCCAALRGCSVLPTEVTFSSTFPDIRQYIWRVDSFPIERKGSLGKSLAIDLGMYPTRTDCNWVLRLIGFANCKNDPAYHVTVEYRGDSTWDSDDFRLDIPASDAILSSHTFTSRKHLSNATNPEHDWLWALHELACGTDAAKLTRKLTSRRANRPNFMRYARRTVDSTLVRRRLVESGPIDDVVTPLEGRRRLEIPLTLYRACVREPPASAGAVKAVSCIQFRAGARTVLRTGRIVTLHPWEGTVGKLASALGEPFLYSIDSVGRGSVRKPAYTCVNAGFGRSGADGVAQ